MADAQLFTLQLKEFAEKAKANAELVVRKVSIDLLTATVMRTPVGNPDLWKHKPPKGYVGGHLRANWFVSLIFATEGEIDGVDPGGDSTISRGVSTIKEWTVGDSSIYITNSLPYAIPVEYGHSPKQAPAGMVRVSVAEAQTFVSEAVASIKV